jgi:hypothetical protein
MENTHGHSSHGQTGESHDSGHSFDTKAIWRTFWILLIITCIELVVGMFIAHKSVVQHFIYNIYRGESFLYHRRVHAPTS